MEAFNDSRYLTVDGKPLLLIYFPLRIPEVFRFTDFWRELAVNSGLKGLFLVGVSDKSGWVAQEYGFDAFIQKDWLPPRRGWVSRRKPIKWIINEYQKMVGKPTIYDYKDTINKVLQDKILEEGDFPILLPNWDNTPRSGSNGLVLHESTPELFKIILKKAVDIVLHRPEERRIIFLKSWNEWAEGNYLEPDLKFGRSYLEVVRDEIYR